MLPEWPLVGRRDELNLVEQELARPGAAGVVLAGSVGVGKTRLAVEVLQRARSGGHAVEWTRATRSAGAIPFGAFAHLLPADLGRTRAFNLLRVAGDAVLDRRDDGPLVLGIDDAHLLDASSAALVRHLSESGDCFLVVTVRSREAAPDAILGLWKDGPLRRIELRSLSADDVAELVPAALGARVERVTLHRLWEASRGNVLYLHELVLGGIDAGSLAAEHGVWRWRGPSMLTPRLAELVDARLGDLGPAERTVLEIVACAEPLEATFLDALTSPPARESVERRGLLETVVTDSSNTVRLSHPLYGEAVRAKTPPTRTSQVFRQLADLLASTGARRVGDVLRLATWRLDAGDLDDPAVFVAAASQAVGLQDFALAERLGRAASRADGFDADLVLATALAGVGNCDEAETLLADLELRAGDDGQRAQAALRRSDNLFGGLGDGVTARTVLAEALATVSTAPWRESLLAASARLELFGGDARRALTTVTQLLEQAEHDPDVLLEVWPLGAWGRILCGMPLAALRFCDELLPRAAEQRGGQHGALLPDLVAHSRCAAAIMAGRLHDADHWSQEADRLSTTTGGAASKGVDAFTRGWTLRVIGRVRTAAETLEEAALALREIDLFRHRSACLGELAHCFALLGDVDRAAAAVAEADAARVASFVLDYAYVEGARAWLAHAYGEHSQARNLTIERARHCAEHGHVVFTAFAWHDLARLGDPSSAVDPLEALAAQVEGALVSAFRAHASALAAKDAAALDRVAVAFERMGAILYGAEAAAAAAGLHRQAGRTGSALTSSAHARQLIERCEGARTPAIAALDTSLPLTARELEIATLAALGHTNRNIAERLVVSVRTVDNHLHNAYVKLGITQRSQLAAILLPTRPADR